MFLVCLPKFLINHDGRPAAATVVAALIWRLCNAQSDLLTPACYGELQSTLLNTAWVNCESCPALNTGEDCGIKAE